MDLSIINDLGPFSQNSLLVPQLPELVSSLVLLLTAGPSPNEGLFTNLSLEPTWRWYFAMTPFETLFLGLIILQFAVLNLFGIMPMNLNTVINGMPGRKKREAFGTSQNKKEIGRQLLKLLKKLDPDECSFKTICELGAHSCIKAEIPRGINSILSSLRLSSKNRSELPVLKSEEENTAGLQSYKSLNVDSDDDILLLYENALKIGDAQNGKDSEKTNGTFTACGIHYSRCPLDESEIIYYVGSIHDLDDLF